MAVFFVGNGSSWLECICHTPGLFHSCPLWTTHVPFQLLLLAPSPSQHLTHTDTETTYAISLVAMIYHFVPIQNLSFSERLTDTLNEVTMGQPRHILFLHSDSVHSCMWGQ